MKAFAVLAFILALAGLSLAASYDVCWPQYVTCSERCCDNVGGSFSENSDGVYCDSSDSGTAQYHTCDNTCVAGELNCVAPGSGCASQYTSCVNSCGATSSSCVNSCSNTAFDCADAAASSNNNTSSSGGCCGALIIVLFAGVSGLLFARKV